MRCVHYEYYCTVEFFFFVLTGEIKHNTDQIKLIGQNLYKTTKKDPQIKRLTLVVRHYVSRTSDHPTTLHLIICLVMHFAALVILPLLSVIYIIASMIADYYFYFKLTNAD